MNYLFFKKITKVNIHLITQLIMSIKHHMKRCRSPPSSGEPFIYHGHIWIFPHGVWRSWAVCWRQKGWELQEACVCVPPSSRASPQACPGARCFPSWSSLGGRSHGKPPTLSFPLSAALFSKAPHILNCCQSSSNTDSMRPFSLPLFLGGGKAICAR